MHQNLQEEQIIQKLLTIKNAALMLRTASSEQKNNTLKDLKQSLISHQKEILSYNQHDVDNCKETGKFLPAFLDRLQLNAKRIEQMVSSLDHIIVAQDPVAQKIDQKVLSNGLKLERLRSPLGVVFLIFESRPNVITEAFSLALKSGNAMIMKGGKETDHTSHFLYQLINAALEKNGLPSDCFWGLTNAKRETTDFMLKQSKLIDVLIPRGGEKLIEYVEEHTSIPLIKNEKGLCHIYVHQKADLKMALAIIDNAKTQRPGVCNAMETLLVDQEIATSFLPQLFELLKSKDVQWFGCPETVHILNNNESVFPASIKNYHTEYLDFKMNVRVIHKFEDALKHIETHGSKHSEAIITSDEKVAQEFLNKVDAAVTYWNASTRFTDGYEFGLGGEIGISTQKLHVRGPVGLESLTTPRWIATGTGQVRI